MIPRPTVTESSK